MDINGTLTYNTGVLFWESAIAVILDFENRRRFGESRECDQGMGIRKIEKGGRDPL